MTVKRGELQRRKKDMLRVMLESSRPCLHPTHVGWITLTLPFLLVRTVTGDPGDSLFAICDSHKISPIIWKKVIQCHLVSHGLTGYNKIIFTQCSLTARFMNHTGTQCITQHHTESQGKPHYYLVSQSIIYHITSYCEVSQDFSRNYTTSPDITP